MNIRAQRALPDPSDYEDEDEFMADCVGQLTDDGVDDDAAEETCALRWDERALARARRKGDPSIGIIHKRSPKPPDGDILEYTLSDGTQDRMGDTIDPDGWKLQAFKRNPIALFNHNPNAPIGTWKNLRVEKSALRGELVLAKEGTSPRIDEIRALVEQKILRGVSVGFRALKHELMDKDDPWGGIKFLEQELIETSLVAVPANANALQAAKSLGISDETMSMVFRRSRSQPTKVVREGTVKISTEKKTMAKKTLAEQISAFEATRAAKAARMTEMMETAGEAGETFDTTQQEEYDGLGKEIKSVDDHLTRLRELERINIAAAVAVNGKGHEEASASHAITNGHAAVHSIQVRSKKKLDIGIPFTRYVLALARAQGNILHAHEIVKANEQWMAESPEVADVLKAAVAAGTTTDPAWAGPLVQYQNLTADFIELLRPATIIGRIPGLRRVPFKVKVPAQTGGATVGWVGEGKAKPLSALAFSSIVLDFAKIAGIVALTDELVRFSSPSAETLVRDDLAAAITQFMDREFIDPAKAATPVSPASITNGITGATPSGTDQAALKTDVSALMAGFLGANLSSSTAVWIMTQQQAMRIGAMQNPLGQPAFPGALTATGGTFYGFPVVASENLPGSPATGYPMILVLANEILLADDGTVTIDASREASLQMDSAPDSPPSATTVLVSLWQNNMIGIKAERFINWQRRRAQAVAWIDGAKYA